jgi:hypothetical protein
MSKQQHTLMRFDPATGKECPYPSHAQQWRDFNGKYAWLFNPWSGERRSAGNVGDDPFGLLMLPPGEPVYAAPATPIHKPLTEERIIDVTEHISMETPGCFISIARAIERAHGIGAAPARPVKLVEAAPRDIGQAQDCHGEHIDKPARQ